MVNEECKTLDSNVFLTCLEKIIEKIELLRHLILSKKVESKINDYIFFLEVIYRKILRISYVDWKSKVHN